MPYVQRGPGGEITGVFTVKQLGYAEELLPDDNAEVVAFRERVGDFKPVPLTEEDRKRLKRESEALDSEHGELRNLILTHFRVWSELETALSALLYEILNIQPRSSHIAYAIYFSSPGFDARKKIVDNALTQFIVENPETEAILPHWKQIHDELRKARDKRNTVAHGSPKVLVIRGEKYMRLTPPAFDVLRVGRKIPTGTIPGLSTKDLSDAIHRVGQLIECVDDVNRIIVAFREHNSGTLTEKFQSLEANLKKIHNP